MASVTSSSNSLDYCVYLCRHGDTAYNSGHGTEKFRSHADIPLTEEGYQEADKLAEYFRDKDIACIYTDSLSRAEETAEAISETTGADVEIDERFRPWDLGELTGKPVNKDNLDILAKYVDEPDKPIPGGESFNEWIDAHLSALDDVLEESLQTGEYYVIVTHTRNAQATKASHATEGGFDDHDIDVKTFMDYENELHTGEILKLMYSKGEWVIEQEKTNADL